VPLKVPHCHCCAYVCVCEGLPRRTDALGSRLKTSRSEQDICRDDNVEVADAFGDPIVGDIRPIGNHNPLYQWVLFKPHPVVGNHKDREAMSYRNADCLSLDRTSIGIDVDLHSPSRLVVLAHRARPPALSSCRAQFIALGVYYNA
jgi:hypothetical protein